MSLPKRIAELGEQADQLQAQLSGETPPQEQGQQAPDPAPQEPQGQQPVAEQVTQPAPAPEPTTPSAPVDGEPTWEQRYKTLYGKYQAEVPRFAADLKDTRKELAVALAEIERLKPKAEAPKAKQPLVTDKDVEAFGSDLIDVIDRKAREVAETLVSTRVSELEAENRRLNEQLTGVTERQVSNDRRAYFADLGRLVPDYEALNVDQGFMNWLAEVDPLSGNTRQDYLATAWNAYDATRTATLFNAYKALTAPPPTPPASQTKQQLEKQVAPGTSKVSQSAPANAASARIWTTGEIAQFYHGVTQGKFYGKDAERARIEAEIDQAVAEGRVR